MEENNQNRLVELIESEHPNIAGITILQNDKTVCEAFFNGCDGTSKLHVYSVSKSILSLLVGIAFDQGYLNSLEQKVLAFFPEYSVAAKEQTIQQITLRDLITMTAPYNYDTTDPSIYSQYFMSSDWATFSLDLLGGQGRIGAFHYTPLIGPDILSAVLVKATGQSVLTFAQENLFAPLGITIEKNITFYSAEEQMAFNQSIDYNGWVCDAKSVNAGGWGLTLSSRDMATIGQLYLNDGQWDHSQIVSPEWLAESTSPHSKWLEMNLSYGYLWWIIDQEKQIFAAIGDGGNVIYCNREKQLVIAIASLFMEGTKDRIELIQQVIEPMIR